MNDDKEMNNWQADWTTPNSGQPATAPEVRLRAMRQQRRLRTGHALELLTALLLLVFSAVVVWRTRLVEAYVWAGVVWVTTAVATAFSLWNWHILWQANVKSVAEYAEDYRKRALATLRAAHFGVGLLAVQVTIALPWITWDYLRGHVAPARFAAAVALLAALSVGFWSTFRLYRSRALAELEELKGTQTLRAPDSES